MADGTLGGNVTDIRTGQPIEGATIDAKGESGSESKSTSAYDGTFGTDLPADTYDLTVAANGYDTGYYPGIHVMEGLTTTLKFALWPMNS